MGLVFLLSLLCVLMPVSATAGMWWWPTHGEWVETERLWMAPPEPWEDHFGVSVAVDGDTMVVGSDRWGFPKDLGYVFERAAEGGWHLAATLEPEVDREGDRFGISVAVDEASSVVVVGARVGQTATVFERSLDGTWERTATLTPEPEDCPTGYVGSCVFGNTVAVSGHTVAVGAPGVTIFEKVDGTWTRADRIGPSSEISDVRIGAGRIELEGDTLVASAFNTTRSEVVFTVFGHGGKGWEMTSVLDPAAPFETETIIPTRVGLSSEEDTIVLGAPVDPRVYGLDPRPQGVQLFWSVGSAWVYELVDGAWVQTAELPNPDPDSWDVFGNTVAVDGSLVVIGAHGDGENGGGRAGAAYVYAKVGGAWELDAKLRNHDATLSEGAAGIGGGDLLGYAVDVSGGTVVVGAPFDDNRRDGLPDPVNDDGDLPPCVHPEVYMGCGNGGDAGSVYVFERIWEVADRLWL